MPHKTVSERRGSDGRPITAEDRVRSQASHATFVVDKVELGQVPPPPGQYFASPCQYRSTNAPHSFPLQYHTYQDKQAKSQTMNFYRIFVSTRQKSNSTLF